MDVKFTNPLLSVCVCLAIASCSPRQARYSPLPKDVTGAGKTIAIVFANSVSIDYEGNVEDEFGLGKTENLIADFILESLVARTKEETCFGEVRVDICRNKSRFNIKHLSLNRFRSIDILLPDSSTRIELESGHSDYVLILHDLAVISAAYLPLFGGREVGFLKYIPRKPLSFSANYAIWDNSQLKLAAFGKTSYEAEGIGFVSKWMWEHVSRLFARNIFENSPFAEWRCRFRK